MFAEAIGADSFFVSTLAWSLTTAHCTKPTSPSERQKLQQSKQVLRRISRSDLSRGRLKTVVRVTVLAVQLRHPPVTAGIAAGSPMCCRRLCLKFRRNLAARILVQVAIRFSFRRLRGTISNLQFEVRHLDSDLQFDSPSS